MKYLFIVNGREDKIFILESVQQQLAELSETPEYEIYKTKSRGDATSFVEEHSRSHASDEICYVACGGDGTICEVASGLAMADFPKNKFFAILAMGTGNDFIKYYKGRDFRSIKALLKAVPHAIDIIKVNDRYSINITNIGFEAMVGGIGGRLSSKGWPAPYRLGIAIALFTGRYNRISVIANGEKIGDRRMLLCTLANNHYAGGEFFCAPRAKNDDGLIDLCFIRTMSLFSFFKMLPSYVVGKHLDIPEYGSKIIYRQCKKVIVTAPKTIELCLDGEMLPGTRFEISIIPSRINLMIP